ncbi:MAG: 3-methyladenine DNA glycosylase [Nocardioides sp.]
MLTTTAAETLEGSQWRARAAAHAARVDAFVEPHLARRAAGEKHPVHDFLFTYYSQRPAQLRRWHPGFGVALADAEEYAGLRGYTTVGPHVAVSPEYVAGQVPLLTATERLLAATAGRPAQLGCFGLHEWAMVHRLAEDGTRHPDWPLRLGPDGTDRVVESHRIACSHFDAFRFFTPSARPLNTLAPRDDDRAAYEQPGCLHGNMDLYKHAFRLSPLVPSDLVADCFALAREIRVMDMRASPYDLADLGLEPIAIETAAGKQVYAAEQRAFAGRAAPLRQRLLDECRRLLTVVPTGSPVTDRGVVDA